MKTHSSDEIDISERDTCESDFVTTLRCSIRQGFPLGFSDDDESRCSFFYDPSSPEFDRDYHWQEDGTIILPDFKLAHIVLSFEQMSCVGVSRPVEDANGTDGNGKLLQKDSSTKGMDVLKRQTQKLDDVVKAIHFAEEDKGLSIDTEVYAWGDNTCNCLVRNHLNT